MFVNYCKNGAVCAAGGNTKAVPLQNNRLAGLTKSGGSCSGGGGTVSPPFLQIIYYSICAHH